MRILNAYNVLMACWGLVVCVCGVSSADIKRGDIVRAPLVVWVHIPKCGGTALSSVALHSAQVRIHE